MRGRGTVWLDVVQRGTPYRCRVDCGWRAHANIPRALKPLCVCRPFNVAPRVWGGPRCRAAIDLGHPAPLAAGSAPPGLSMQPIDDLDDMSDALTSDILGMLSSPEVIIGGRAAGQGNAARAPNTPACAVLGSGLGRSLLAPASRDCGTRARRTGAAVCPCAGESCEEKGARGLPRAGCSRTAAMHWSPVVSRRAQGKRRRRRPGRREPGQRSFRPVAERRATSVADTRHGVCPCLQWSPRRAAPRRAHSRDRGGRGPVLHPDDARCGRQLRHPSARVSPGRRCCGS